MNASRIQETLEASLVICSKKQNTIPFLKKKSMARSLVEKDERLLAFSSICPFIFNSALPPGLLSK
jgi:hypothetical protein